MYVMWDVGTMLHLKQLQKPNWKVHMVYEQSLTGPCPSDGYQATAVSVPISSSAPIPDVAELVPWCTVQGAADICTPLRHYAGQLANYPGL